MQVVSLEEQQKRRGFLTGQELKCMRSELSMSLREFAKLVGVTHSVINQIENGVKLQSAGTDSLIRNRFIAYKEKTDPKRVRAKKVFSYLIQQIDTSKLFLNKMMFYIDFWHFKKTGESITGMTYIPLQYGPCPDGYDTLLKEMIEEKTVSQIKGHRFKLNSTPDMSELTPEEMETINTVIKIGLKDNAEKLFNLSHEERGFIETPLYQPISHEYAKDLRIEELLSEIA